MYYIFTCTIKFSGVRLRCLFLFVCHFVCIFCTLDTFPSEAHHKTYYNPIRYKTIYHVVKKLRSWNHGVNQVDNFLNSQVLELIVAQTDGELLSAFGHHGLNQLAERCCKSNYLVIDWWFCQKTNTLFLLASNIFPRVRRAVPELVKLF